MFSQVDDSSILAFHSHVLKEKSPPSFPTQFNSSTSRPRSASPELPSIFFLLVTPGCTYSSAAYYCSMGLSANRFCAEADAPMRVRREGGDQAEMEMYMWSLGVRGVTGIEMGFKCVCFM